jgi:hypothetical protein
MDAPAYAETAPAYVETAPAYAGTVPTEAPVPAMSRHDHKGLFGWRHCTECQRARAKARDGIDVPPPPSAALPPGTIVPGSVVYGHEHGHQHGHQHGQPPVMLSHVQEGTCVACEQAAGTIVSGPAMSADPTVPGYASVGGPSGPGYASVGGDAPPSPIGVARAHAGPAGISPGRPGFGTQDASIMPASAAIPAAPTPMGDTGPTRPHVLGHLFGVSDLARERRERRGLKAQKLRDQHAAIAYDEKSQPVTELPASVVYGK